MAADCLSVTEPVISPVLACDWAGAGIAPRPIIATSAKAQSEWNGFLFDIFPASPSWLMDNPNTQRPAPGSDPFPEGDSGVFSPAEGVVLRLSEPARRLRGKPPPAPRVHPCASEVPLDRSVFWERHGNSKSRTSEFAQSSTLAALKLAALNIDCTELAALRTGQKDASFPSQKPRLGVKPLREASDTLLDGHYQVKEIGC